MDMFIMGVLSALSPDSVRRKNEAVWCSAIVQSSPRSGGRTFLRPKQFLPGIVTCCVIVWCLKTPRHLYYLAVKFLYEEHRGQAINCAWAQDVWCFAVTSDYKTVTLLQRQSGQSQRGTDSNA